MLVNTPVIQHTSVPHQTLYDRINGKLPHKLAQEQLQGLTHAEEKELVQWITSLTITGYYLIMRSKQPLDHLIWMNVDGDIRR